MLLELHIKNFALIDKVDMIFSKGLNILTGETGAGKSILIDSVNFILGDKQNKDIIRTGQEAAYVEAVFDSQSKEIEDILLENGVEVEEILIISREINQSGRSISRINGRTVTISFLKQIGRLLVDIHGQHEHQSLLNEAVHIDILDSFCGERLRNLKKEYLELYVKNNTIEKQLEKLATDEQFKLRRIDLLSFQIQEISDAKLIAEEDIELGKRKMILSNSEKIFSTLSGVYEKIYESREGECAYDGIGSSLISMDSIADYDEAIKDMKDEIQDIYYKLGDIIGNIREYIEHCEFDPNELDEIENRLDIISKLKRKYGSTIEEILDYYNKSSQELEQIQRSDELINGLTKQKNDSLKILNEYANKMTQIRRDISESLKQQIENELKYLGMERAIFRVEINEKTTLTENGKDEVYFLMTANPGEPLRQLSKVASGGEMSRIMLAIKSVIADIDRIPTLIFDEIDIGISGRTAQSVGEKMCQISSNHQILSVTHLPQIASMGDVHFKIQKTTGDETTTTNVNKLNNYEQIDELARMLSGTVITDLTRNHAKEVLELANIKKDEIKKHAN
ncbi:MAG: repair protein RecN [Clostridiales bacterium]|nr:repair protein RecN [Clostridiales bacterium]